MCAQAISRFREEESCHKECDTHREEESCHKECDTHTRLLSLGLSAQCARHIVCVAHRYTIHKM
jgi:hypothetical protein